MFKLHKYHWSDARQGFPGLSVIDLLTFGLIGRCFLFGGGKGGSTGSQDTRMERKGTSTSTSERVLPASLQSLVQGVGQSSISGPSADGQTSLGQIIRRESGTNPGYSTGKSLAGIDPMSDSYKQLTDSEFNNRLADALALARSGEENVLAPISRGQTMREAEVIRRGTADRGRELREARVVDSGIQQGAQQNIAQNVIEASRAQAGSSTQMTDTMLKLSDLLGKKIGSTTDDISGRGAQSSSSSSWASEASLGGLCCWILLESYYGVMPWWVRECRDEFAPENTARRDGYRRMAQTLVPAMRKSRTVRGLVRWLMVKPLEFWGAYYKQVPGYRWGWAFKPFVKFWFTTWTLIGKKG